MQNFKHKPPLVQAIRFEGDFANVRDIITELAALDLSAAYVPTLWLKDADGKARLKPLQLIVFEEGGTRIHTVGHGEWIVWDPKLLDKNALRRSNRAFVIMGNAEFETRYMTRESGEN